MLFLAIYWIVLITYLVDFTHRRNFNTPAQQGLIQEFLEKYGCERFKGKSGELF